MSNVFFKKNNAVNIDTIFEDINLGAYSNTIKFKNTVLDSSVKKQSNSSIRNTAPDKKYVNKEEENCKWLVVIRLYALRCVR